MDNKEIKENVKERYAKMAAQSAEKTNSGCSCGCGNSSVIQSEIIGYDRNDLSSVPSEANLGLGCGNPLAHAALKEGETVLDLGSGGGIDCFLAAAEVGKTGFVIGVDMTPEMIELAEKNALQGGYKNVEFRLGEIESLPVDDDTCDVIISNCVINLSPDKQAVFNEAYRVLQKGGRIVVSDIVLQFPLPEEILESVPAYIACVSGAMVKQDYLNLIKKAGFRDIKILDEAKYDLQFMLNDEIFKEVRKKMGTRWDDFSKEHAITSMKVTGYK
ncbi:MAG: arsenite methyltransferase [Acidobacteria bacterium]|nr:arsenite methyltransferase [Acidobacteriota bacterium]